MNRVAMGKFFGWMFIACTALAGEPASPAVAQAPTAAQAPTSQEDLEKQFAETMSGATLVGRFTVIEDKQEQPLKEDRYTLGEVKKLKNGLWSFETRIQYGDHDVKVPLALDVKWAGDTPVITLTDVLVPGLGTFTSRVLVYRGWYAGTWSGANHGGHLFGRIERGADAKSAVPADKK
jgi:hypothetical protein